MRQGEGPLPHRDIGEHVVHEMRRPLSHPPPTAARTEAAPLARIGDEALSAAVSAAEPREASSQEAAAQERPEFVLNEPGKAIALPGGLGRNVST